MHSPNWLRLMSLVLMLVLTNATGLQQPNVATTAQIPDLLDMSESNDATIPDSDLYRRNLQSHDTHTGAYTTMETSSTELPVSSEASRLSSRRSLTADDTPAYGTPKAIMAKDKNKNSKNNSSDDSGSSTTTIIIAVAAGVGGLLLIIITIICCCACKKKKTPATNSTSSMMKNGSSSDLEMSKQYDMQTMPPPTIAMANKTPVQAYPVQINYAEIEDPVFLPGAAGPLGAGPVATRDSAMSQQRYVNSAAYSAMPSQSMMGGMPPQYPAQSQQGGGYQDELLTWVNTQIRSEGRKSSRRTGSSHRVDISAFAIPFEELKIGKRIGEGSFGKVYLASWHETPVAVKVLVDETTALDAKNDAALRKISEDVMDKLAEEASLMSSLRHPNIVQFMGVCKMPPAIVTEYCARSSLTDVLKEATKDPEAAAFLTWERRLRMAIDAATGMLHLHARSPPIIHRDLKSPNLLVDVHWKVKVADFNLSRLLADNGQSSSLAAMNPRWLAPELLEGESASARSDVFAFAVVMWELLTWQLPWSGQNSWSVVHLICQGGRLELPDMDDLKGPDDHLFPSLPEYVALMKRCWAQNPYDRPSFQDIIAELRAMLATAPKQEHMSPGSSGARPAMSDEDLISRASVGSVNVSGMDDQHDEINSMTTQFQSRLPQGRGDELNSMNTQYQSKIAQQRAGEWTSRLHSDYDTKNWK